MHITVLCPFCLVRYQLDPNLRGERMRCPNRSCREVFEIKEIEAETPRRKDIPLDVEVADNREQPRRHEASPGAPLRKAPKSGMAGDVVPMLPTAAVTPPDVVDWREQLPPRRNPAAAETDPASWSDEPAPTRTADTKPKTRRRSSDSPLDVEPAPAEMAAAPVELPAGAWEPPPIHRPEMAEAAEVPKEAESHRAESGEDHFVPPHTSRHGLKIIAALGLVVACVLGIAGYFTWTIWRETEETQAAEAQQAYADGHFDDAAKKFGELAKKYPTSDRAAEYRFFQQLSDLRASLTAIGVADLHKNLAKLDEFLETQKDSEFLEAHLREVGESLVRFLMSFADGAVKNVTPETTADVDAARRVLDQIQRRYPKTVRKEERTQLEKRFDQVLLIAAQARQRNEFLDFLRQLIFQGSADAVKIARQQLRKEVRSLPALATDKEVAALFDQLYEEHRKKVAYGPEDPLPAQVRDTEDNDQNLLVDATVGASGVAAPDDDKVILALARGVLYALARTSGRVRWATRVGVDITSLPVRVPTSRGKPETVLVLSADARLISAVDSRDGATLWKRRLPSPCVGRPVVLDGHGYFATVSGKVHEIDLGSGQLQGRFDLGQRLGVGGANLEGTKFLFFPAEENCVYILNAAKHECEGVLYTEHPAGSLRDEPILVRAEDVVGGPPANPHQMPPGFLILGETDGLDAWELHAFGLPAANPLVKPEPVQPEARLPGWPWFPPFRDSEKLVQVTDAGYLGLFGLRQAGNQDPILFPLVGGNGSVNLKPWTSTPAGPSGNHAIRKQAQVVLCQDRDLWVLSNDVLLRLQLTFNPLAGPQVIATTRWAGPLPLGSPLHASQVDENGTTLFLVTRPARQSICLATAVDAASGKFHWQRQLGMVSQRQPIVFGKELLALDQGGGLFRFDPEKHPNLPDHPWQIVGNNLVAPAIDGTFGGSVFLVQGSDGASAVEVAMPSGGTQLLARHYRPARDGNPYALQQSKQELAVKATTTIAGPPALRGDNLLAPMTDKSLLWLRLPLTDNGRPDPPIWRAQNARADARGYVVWIGDEDFITTNGAQGMTRWHWPADGACQSIPPEHDANVPTVELAANIVAPPVTLKGENDGDPVQILVADAGGVLYLFRADNLEKPVRIWNLKGKISAGPYVQGKRAGCVVDGTRLIWVDPDRDGPVWEYKGTGQEIVGEPQIVAGMVLVADQSGRFVGLDPEDGIPDWPGYSLQGSVTPVCSPTAFGPDRAFAPLADGTILLLSLQKLRNPFRGVFLVW